MFCAAVDLWWRNMAASSLCEYKCLSLTNENTLYGTQNILMFLDYILRDALEMSHVHHTPLFFFIFLKHTQRLAHKLTLSVCVCVSCSWKQSNSGCWARNPDGMSTTLTAGGDLNCWMIGKLTVSKFLFCFIFTLCIFHSISLYVFRQAINMTTRPLINTDLTTC